MLDHACVRGCKLALLERLIPDVRTISSPRACRREIEIYSPRLPRRFSYLINTDEVFGTHRPRKPSLSSSPWMRGARMEFSVHTTQRKRFLSAERANYRFFCFAKIKFQLSL